MRERLEVERQQLVWSLLFRCSFTQAGSASLPDRAVGWTPVDTGLASWLRTEAYLAEVESRPSNIRVILPCMLR